MIRNRSSHLWEFGRYVVNGVIATGFHFSLLTIFIEVLRVESAGIANLLAASAAITLSFLGNRYFVFRQDSYDVFHQAARFGALYAGIACLHGLFLWGWTDVGALNYRYGFLCATFVQVMLSYFGNKYLVFK